MNNVNKSQVISIMYRNSNEEVIIPCEYKQKDVEFRASWVTPLIGDIARFSSVEQYKKELLSVLDTLQSYNMNVIIFIFVLKMMLCINLI